MNVPRELRTHGPTALPTALVRAVLRHEGHTVPTLPGTRAGHGKATREERIASTPRAGVSVPEHGHAGAMPPGDTP